MAKNSKRVKPDNKLIAVKDWAHADKLLREMGNAQIAIQAAEAIAAKHIANTKAALVTAAKPDHERITQIAKSLEAFATCHRQAFEGKKSKDLTFGILGWRLSKSIRIKKDTTLEFIKYVFKRRAHLYIHATETPDKEALAKLTDEQLAAVKARWIVKDDFFVEPKLPEAVDYPESK